MKAKSLIISLILIVCFAGIGIGLYCAWPAITGTITDSKYYTSEDLQDAYDKGFDDAFKNKDELTQQVDYYKELTDTYYVSILDYQAQIKDYETLTENNKNTISTLEQNKTELQTQVDNLTSIKNSNEETISDLQDEVSTLENQVKILTNSDSGKTEEIAELNKQIASLNALISQLQNTNTLNVNTIASLNSQIESLNTQISNMTLQNQTASSQITALNNKISELQESINYYEQYIASLENGEQVVATFEFDGSVYNIQIVNKNSIVTVTIPTSTDYVIFNYWTVNGEQVDLSTYQITTNTKFVADVTHKYDVKFKVDNSDYDSQIVVENGFATLPEEPTKTGYEFDGWSLNGVDVVENITTTAVTENTTYYAVFTKLHTVTFTYEEEVKSTQQVRNGEYATDVEIEDTTYKVFNGWTYENSLIDLNSYKIYSDITFVADIIYKFDVKFIVDNVDYDNQIVVENGIVTLPEEPIKIGYKFLGWTLDGDSVINLTSTNITENITFYAKFEIAYTDAEFCELALNEMKNGVLDLSPYPISEIPERQFQSNSAIKSIIFSDTIERINMNAFAYCKNLSNLIIPETIKQIDVGAFGYCVNLKNVAILGSTYVCAGSFSNNGFLKVFVSKNTIMNDSLNLLGGPFFGNELIIYTDAETKSDVWTEGWDKIGVYPVVYADVVYNTTYEEFLTK